MPKLQASSKRASIHTATAGSSPTDQRRLQHQRRERLCVATGILWFVAGISVGSFITGTLSITNINTTRFPIHPTKTSSSSLLSTPTSRRRPQYYELEATIDPFSKSLTKGHHYQRTAYDQATIVHKAPWLPSPNNPNTGHKLCRDTCCVETVAISLHQDARQLIHSTDGNDLADTMIVHGALGGDKMSNLKFHASYLHPQILPCLVPHTIIQVDNHLKPMAYFWRKIRPHIKVPYILISAGSDADSPQIKPQFIQDPLLLKWYGTNPNTQAYRKNPAFMRGVQEQHKFVPMNLGLSRQNFPKQEQHLLPYLQLTNFTNPFLFASNKERWDFAAHPLQDFDQEVFVQFGMTSVHRRTLWALLCPPKNNDEQHTGGASCNPDTGKLTVHNIYTDLSQYRFGVSPPGVGWDCFRTYEMLLLGVIPILEDRGPISRQLFAGLPVVFIPNMVQQLNAGTLTKEVFLDAIRNYIQSDEFQKGDFTGWDRLFLHRTRRQLLEDAGRTKEILVDAHGQEYYQAYKYTVIMDDNGIPVPPKPLLCSDPNNCLSPKELQEMPDYLLAKEDWYEKPPPPLEGDDKAFVAQWKQQRRIQRPLKTVPPMVV
ncbi:expressed unknown protein [Seminavis robusta]|uniref:Exostosin GT47 domain-containing protein n=1 Tax=Seminavis robusta TaxID=568900 RepID=A0A9N8HD93_9STRA|nr:expressed unknown protein [Seminavis robusta]|eukprot:Sro449_g145290.1 n/a (599) ;mRNA; r:20332-22128